MLSQIPLQCTVGLRLSGPLWNHLNKVLFGVNFGSCILLFRLGAPPKGRATKNWSIDSLSCSPPRKSLVKGERFMRVEGKPELMINFKDRHYLKHVATTIVGLMI